MLRGLFRLFSKYRTSEDYKHFPGGPVAIKDTAKNWNLLQMLGSRGMHVTAVHSRGASHWVWQDWLCKWSL